jgi:hypothetical protein
MNPWLSAIPIAVAVGCISYWLFYSISFFRSSGYTLDVTQLEILQRKALVRAAVLLVVTLLGLGFRVQLTNLVASRKPGPSATEIKVWVNTRSGFYYCPGTDMYGKLQPGKYMTETSALESGYQPSLKQTCR